MKIQKIYDNQGKTWDRYSILTSPTECLGLSDNCDSPSGFSQWSLCEDGEHLGKLITFSELPENVQKHLVDRLLASLTTADKLQYIAEFEDLLASDPDFNYDPSEFDKWLEEVILGA